jgi:3-oxoacyl-[acyl-carrier-protein] synthase III
MGPKSVRVTGWGMYVPEHVLTNDDLSTILDTSDEWIRPRTGIAERRIAWSDETSATMASKAAVRAIAAAGLQPDDIDMIVMPTISPDHPVPACATLVKAGIGNTKAAAFDLNAACSGFLYGYAMAHSYLQAGFAKHVLLVSAETLSRMADYTDRALCVLVGDGAGAVVLSASEEAGGGLMGLELTAHPEGAYWLWKAAGGSAFPVAPTAENMGMHQPVMDGQNTYKMATRTMASTAVTAMERAGVTADEVALFVPHQANARIIETVGHLLGLPDEKIFLNIGRYGNTSAASIGIALAEACEMGKIKQGDKIVLVGFGGGFTSGGIVIDWTADVAAGNARAAAADISGVQIPRPAGWPFVEIVPQVLIELFAKKEAREREAVATGA